MAALPDALVGGRPPSGMNDKVPGDTPATVEQVGAVIAAIGMYHGSNTAEEHAGANSIVKPKLAEGACALEVKLVPASIAHSERAR